MNDISSDFKPEDNLKDKDVVLDILKYEATPAAIQVFAKRSSELTDYSYWFLLGTLWVSYSGWSDLNLWKRLLRSPRNRRQTSLMKPSEINRLSKLSATLTVYRAHRIGETDWISYTLDAEIAERFALERDVDQIAEYKIKKKDVVALFMRRGEQEVILLDKKMAKFIGNHSLINIGTRSDNYAAQTNNQRH